MISGLFILSHKGDPIIQRIYRDDITKAAMDVFKVNVIHSRTGIRSPIISISKKSFFHLYRNNLYLVAVTAQNANACMMVEFLKKFLDLCNAYFGTFTETSVKNNFSLIYEFLDEVVDNGYPQSTDPDVLKILTEDAKKMMGSAEGMQEIASQVTGQIGWRREGIKYKKHEVYLDVVEKVNCLLSKEGQPLSAHVSGAIQMKCHLSGMPECKFGINDILTASKGAAGGGDAKKKGKKKSDPIAIDDLTFHQCVKLSKFDANRSISFVPPDGEFDLINYRVTADIQLPFKFTTSVIEATPYNGNVMEVNVTMNGNFDKKHIATNVLVTIPIPTSASKVALNAHKGKAKYKAGANNVVWKLKTFHGARRASIDIRIELLPVTGGKKSAKRPPIGLSFEAPFACSGLIVKYLIVAERKLGYDDSTVLKWVRYLSSNGEYEQRY